MNEVKNEKKKIFIYEGVLSVEELKVMNKDNIVLPLSIMEMEMEMDTLIKIVNGYGLDLSLISLFMYYEKLVKDGDTNVVYFKLNPSKLASIFENEDVTFEFLGNDNKVRNVNKIYSVEDDVRLEFVEKGRLLKKNIETVSLTDLVNYNISNYLSAVESESIKVR